MPRCRSTLTGAILLFGLAGSRASRAEPPPAQQAGSLPEASPGVTEPPESAEASTKHPESSGAPAEVTVVGTRVARTAGSAHVLNHEKLERFSYDDAHAIVQQVPGVYVRQEDGVGLRPNIGIRGVNPDRSKKLTLLEDGVLFGPAPYSAPAAYYFPVMTRVTSVRVIKGPAAVSYGPQSVGGVIDFVTRRIPERPRGALDLSLGEYGYGKAHGYFGSSDDQLGFLVEGVRVWNEGFKELPSGADTGSTRNDWMAKFSYVLDPLAVERNEFRLKLSYSDEVSNETYLGLTDADFRKNPYQRYFASALDQMKNHRGAVVFSHLLESPVHALKLRTDVYRHEFARTWRKANRFRGASLFELLTEPDDPSHGGYLAVLRGETDAATAGETLLVGPNQREFVSQGVQSVVDIELKSGLVSQRFQSGVRLHHDRIEREHSESPFIVAAGELLPEGGAPEVTAANRASSTALSLNMSDAIGIREWTVTPGVRAELIHSKTEDFLNGAEKSASTAAWMPGIGVYHALSEALGLLAGVYRGFSPPAPGSDAEVKPEFSVNYEAGARFSSGPTRAEVIGFYNDYSNLTDVCTMASGCLAEDLDRQFDAGRARIYGLEAYAADALPLTAEVRLPFTAAYTFTQARFSSSFESNDPIYGDVREDDEIPYVPEHQLNVTLGVESPWVSVAGAVNYVSRMREQAGSAPLSQVLATDEQLVVDLSARAPLVGGFSLYGNVRNLFDTAHIVSRRPYGARPNPPRWIQVGAKIEF